MSVRSLTHFCNMIIQRLTCKSFDICSAVVLRLWIWLFELVEGSLRLIWFMTKIVHDIYSDSFIFFILNLRYSIYSDLIASVESPFAPLLNGMGVIHLKLRNVLCPEREAFNCLVVSSVDASDLKRLSWFLHCNSNVKLIIRFKCPLMAFNFIW